MSELAGRTAVVTGGASGIGRAIALALAERGARVAVLDVHAEHAARVTAEARGGDVLAVAWDVTSAASVASAAAAVRTRFGPVHVLVNSHGISGFGTLPDLAEADWLRMLDVHLNGV